MSADNWTECPNCGPLHYLAKEKAIKEVNDQYGKISMDKFLTLKAELEEKLAMADEDVHDTLREDYFIGIRDGGFRISYSGRCDRCGFKYEYKNTIIAQNQTKEKLVQRISPMRA